jgi:hypothetical protein
MSPSEIVDDPRFSLEGEAVASMDSASGMAT